MSQNAFNTAAGEPKIYVACPATGYPTKIGVTRHPTRRLREIQRQMEEEIFIRALFKSWDSCFLVERDVKSRLSSKRLAGEWFGVSWIEMIGAIYIIQHDIIYLGEFSPHVTLPKDWRIRDRLPRYEPDYLD